MNADIPSFDNLPPRDQQAVRDAKEVHSFFVEKIAPRLTASRQEVERFLEAPFQYLVDAGCPVLPSLSQEKAAAFDALVATSPDGVTADNITCWICTKAFEVAITVIVMVGVVITLALIAALASALSGAAGLVISIVLTMIATVGIAVGVQLLAEHVYNLARLICKEIGDC